MKRELIQARLFRVRQLMQAQDLPALMVSRFENVRYLSGFTGDSGGLLITPKHTLLSTDSRFWEQAEREAPDFALHKVYKRVRSEWVPQTDLLAMADNPKRVGIEAASITLVQFETMQAQVPDVEWVTTTDLIERVRAVKDADELVAIQKAIDVAEAGFVHLRRVIKPGMTERQAAWEMEAYMRTHGAEALGFETIVAAGPNGAMAHYHAGDRAIQPGEPIVIDWGATVDGYISDMTRTFALGDGDAKYREIYDVVLRAQAAAIAGAKAGMEGKALDALARDVIVQAGYGDNFGHGLGHGVGLAVHEQPRVSRYAENEILPAGSVITIEPGIYLPGWGGVRIEDMVLVKEDGVEVLTHLPK